MFFVFVVNVEKSLGKVLICHNFRDERDYKLIRKGENFEMNAFCNAKSGKELRTGYMAE
jgi:hypothetical protein